MALRSFDTFVKPRHDLRTRSALGGFITLVATIAASLLFLAEVYLYVVGSTKHSLHLAPSSWVPLLPTMHGKIQSKDRIPLNIHITFPHIPCRDLDPSHDNAFMSKGDFQKLHGSNALRLRSPTMDEVRAIKTDAKDSRDIKDACTIQGSLKIPKVGGSFQITISQRAWQQATTAAFFGKGNQDSFPNVTHHIHSVTFGEHFPLAHNPLENAPHVFINEYGGVGLSLVAVRLVPTQYKKMFSEQLVYQSSVAHTFVKPETLAASGSNQLPGLIFNYDFTPLAVRHEQYRESFLVFLSSLVSIVGGVFVTVSLVTGCLVHSAAAVAKKMD